MKAEFAVFISLSDAVDDLSVDSGVFRDSFDLDDFRVDGCVLGHRDCVSARNELWRVVVDVQHIHEQSGESPQLWHARVHCFHYQGELGLTLSV